MNAEEKNKEIDINEVAITLEVDSEVIAKVRSGDGDCITRIIDVETTPGTRFDYQGAGKPIVEDEDVDSCIYEWEEARRGDLFFMMRTGDEFRGVAA